MSEVVAKMHGIVAEFESPERLLMPRRRRRQQDILGRRAIAVSD